MKMQIEEIRQFKEMCSDISILMVDDEVELTSYYREIAERFFKSVEIANSGEEAIELFESNKYDLIYSDINMPGMNGIELIRAIKEFDVKQKFIVISASDEAEKLMELLSLNISGFILKPFTLDNFVSVSKDQVSIVLQSRLMEKNSLELNKKLDRVTQEKQEQEQMLIQQSKLAQTGEMISMIAHQWRQPLSSITTIMAGLKMRLELGAYELKEDPLAAFVLDFDIALENIESSAEFLSKTINDFRNFYRPDNEKKLFNVYDAMDSVLRMLNLEKENISVELISERSDESNIFTFEGELKQVFMSIINNATDAMKENSTQDAKISISIYDKDDTVYVSIADNAGGIPPNIIENIFLPYFSTKNEKNGTGLGLHMAKTIIEHHVEGDITVQNSDKFGGAEFILKMPKSKKEG